MEPEAFSEAELAYLYSQPLGRLATVAADGAPQNNPVGFVHNRELQTIDVFGFNLGASRKFRNVGHQPRIALVVDDLVSPDPWEVRGIEIRGMAEPLDHIEPPMAAMSPQVIRIHPSRILSWNVEPARQGMWARNVEHPLEVA